MSEIEDFDALKVAELQNEHKKLGLDTKGHNNGIEADGTTKTNTESNDFIKDDTSYPSSAIKDDDDGDDDESPDRNEMPYIEEHRFENEDDAHSPSSKKRPLIDEEESRENNEDNSIEDQTNELDTYDETNPNDDLSQQKRKKKSRWGTEQDDDSSEKQSITRQTSESDDHDNNDDDHHTIDDNSSSRHRERDYRSSRQHDDDRHYSSRRSEKSAEREIPLPEEEIVQFNNEDVVLDFYTSDLHLAVNTDCLSASTKSTDALCFLWAGVRTTYGFQQGKICYEIRIAEIIDCPQMPESETEKFGVRIGWSNLSSGLQALQLGEFNDSFAYTSAGKKMSKTKNESTEDNYGEPFGVSDVIAAYIDFDEDLIRISFTKNGQDCGQAFEIPKNDYKEFYPHILVKNAKFECNFGQLENSWLEMKTDYIFAQNIPLIDRIRTSEPIIDKGQCEVLLLSGLTGSGKTTWAKKHLEDNRNKNFNLLNIEYVLEKMTIDGKLPAIKDRNDSTMLRVNVCLQKLIEIAAQRRRNYIIDHVNITRESQIKRQRLFPGYHRIAVVIVPDDDELKRRLEKLERQENISMPSHWIREGKAKFYLPQKSSSLEDVIYPELNYDDAKNLYDRARRDYDQHRSSSSRYDRHDDYHSSRNNNRNRYDDRDRRSRERDRYARSRSRSRDRDRDRRTSSRDDSRFSSSHRNDNFRGGYSRGGGGGRYGDHRQDSRNQRGGFHDGPGGGNQYRGRGGYNNQSMDERRGGGYQQQRNDFGGNNRGRGGFDNNRNQYSQRGSFHDNSRSGGGFRQDSNNQQRGRQFNDYDRNQSQQQSQQRGGRGFMPNNNNNNSYNQQQDRQGYGSRPPMQQQQQQHSYQNQQQQPQQHRPQPLLQNPPSNQQQQQQQQFPIHMLQQAVNNPNLSLQTHNPLGINQIGNVGNANQQNSLDSWLALCAAALNPQATAAATVQQPQQDANSLTQQWAQWLKTAQIAQTAQQTQPQIAVQQPDPQQQQQQQAQLADASALYYQAYYAQLAAAQQQAAAQAAASGSLNSGVAPPGSGNK